MKNAKILVDVKKTAEEIKPLHAVGGGPRQGGAWLKLNKCIYRRSPCLFLTGTFAVEKKTISDFKIVYWE